MTRRLLPVLVLALAGCATPATRGASSTEAADFTLRTVRGEPFTLSEHLGQKVILLDFWATWCAPCTAEMPHLQEMWDRYRDQGLLVVGVSMDGPETVAQVAPFVASRGFTFPVLLDEETRAVSLYNPHRSAPYVVLFGRDGRVASTREGYNAGDERALEATVAGLLEKGSPPATPAPAPAAP